ncbi:MAG TPA: NADH dehydrogenase subunit [Verrucomicrobia bacterium]|nr:MAG: hypothetical protein A2X46_00860 [Lentisphaerae bacterium GWF2_57_35]HBA83782.1 NADH dehydrogenase subunit [Verrucomicrobiota bacterium]
MIEQANITTLERSELLSKVGELFNQGYRLVQICCTLKDAFELSYSFDKDHALLTLRLQVSREDAQVPSVSGIYFCALVYENEMHDLFGLNVTDMALDFQGTFYKTAIKTPFNTPPPIAK